MIERVCQQCGKTFFAKPVHVRNGHAKFCSKDCHNQSMKSTTLGNNNHWYKEEVSMICKHCGQEFFVKPGKVSKRKYCSLKCAYASNDRAKRGEESNLWKGGTRSPKKKYPERVHIHDVTCIVCGKQVRYEIKNKRAPVTCGSKECINQRIRDSHPKKTTPVELNCVVCGKPVVREEWVARKYKYGAVCSDECRMVLLLKEVELSKKDMVTLTCECCGEKFQVKPSVAIKRKCCSRSCAGKMKVGEKNGRWMGGISFDPYCEKFNNNFRERVREFWGRRCAICGRSENNNVTPGWRLSVHHVHYNKDACCNPDSPALFAPVCTACHSLTSGKYSRKHWEEYLHNLIMEKYNGKCFYTKEEYNDILRGK